MLHAHERIETDVVIIGGGMSGLSAAITLSKSTQVRCVLVEKSHVLGGSSKLSAGMFWAPMDAQIAQETIPFADPELLNKIIADYPDAVQWMRDNGVQTYDQFNGIMTIGIGFPINVPQWLAKAESIITAKGHDSRPAPCNRRGRWRQPPRVTLIRPRHDLGKSQNEILRGGA